MNITYRENVWFLPQDPFVYLSGGPEAFKARLSDSAKERRFAKFQKIYFSPWFQDEPMKDREDVVYAFKYYSDKMVQKFKNNDDKVRLLRGLQRRACLDEYPNAGWHAITVMYADLRGLPVEDKKMRRLKMAHLVDSVQVSSVYPNTPVFVSHVSRDGKWVLVETNFAYGWVPASKIARVDKNFIEKWSRGEFVAIIRDGVPVCSGGVCYFKGYIGSLFPFLRSDGETFTLGVATRGLRGMAVMRSGTISTNDGVLMPLTLNRWNVAVLASALLGGSYGWGGKNGTRDCSSLLRDLFLPFGIWLPRHSADQAREGGLFVDLSGLNEDEKKQHIIEDGEPFLTLLWRRGHIMLYVGSHGGEPVVLHSMGGLLLRDEDGRVKRISGRTAITTLHLGRDLGTFKVNKDVNHLKHIAGMAFIAK
ncbi:MAG: SH3 domain-containing protein [Syntrophales bacterium]|nr:SH3 domain-containing protein [Syntrophales bacterium]